MSESIALRVTLTQSPGRIGYSFAHFDAIATAIDTGRRSSDCDAGDVVGLSSTHDLSGFQITSQSNPEDENRYFYGSRYAFHNVHCVEPCDAERMVTTFRKIEKSLEKQRKAGGHISDQATFIFRVAKAISAAFFIVELTGGARELCGYQYHAFPVDGEGYDRLRAMEREYCERRNEQHKLVG